MAVTEISGADDRPPAKFNIQPQLLVDTMSARYIGTHLLLEWQTTKMESLAEDGTPSSATSV
jgi:hypothetical protein